MLQMYFQREGLRNLFLMSYFGKEEEENRASSIFSCLEAV